MIPTLQKRIAPTLVGSLALFALSACPAPPVAPVEDGDGAVLDVAPDTAADSVETGPEIPEVECAAAAECAAAGGAAPQCQAWTCEAGVCGLGPTDEGQPCDDGSSCTDIDSCAAGVCVGEASGCDDANPCTTDGCNADSECVHTANGKPCDDGSACTTSDFCADSACTGTAIDCDDANPCTADACSLTDGCKWTALSGPCDDGDACTAAETCIEAVCTTGGDTNCDDGNSCTADACDGVIGCTHEIIDIVCDDGDICTEADTCIEGLCTGTMVVCDDDNACTSPDYCDAATGCIYPANIVACDDGDPCTLDDQCAEGSCVGGGANPECCAEASECDDGDGCTTDGCEGGFCDYSPLDCDDGAACTADACTEGVCSNTPYGPLPSGSVFFDDFDGGGTGPGWMITTDNPDVTWQLDASTVFSGAASIYAGNIPSYSYDFGQTTTTLSQTVTLPPGTAKLELMVWQSVSEVSCEHDATHILIDGVEVLPAICETTDGWASHEVDLSPWAGTSVTLAFQFATGDAIANKEKGVWLDDIRVVADAPKGCCVEGTDCPEPDGPLDEEGVELPTCQMAECAAETFVCMDVADDLSCDDDNICTSDACAADGSCVNADLPNCCARISDCPAPDPECATVTCVENVCGLDLISCE